MRCERCQTEVATVHATMVIPFAAEPTTNHYCESCYGVIAASALETAGPIAEVREAPTVDVEHLTATEYLEVQDRARHNPCHIPAFRRVLTELARFPATRLRLAVEFLEMAGETLERGGHPGFLIATSGNFLSWPKAKQPGEYVARSEKLVRRIIELLRMPAAGESGAERAIERFDPALFWSLVFACVNLKRVAPRRHAAVVKEMKAESNAPRLDRLRNLMVQVAERMRRLERNRG